MKDPPPDLPEYIELLNTSDTSVDLRDWQIGDSRSLRVISRNSFLLEPDSFLVITDDSIALANHFGDHFRILEIRSLPALNNGGDQIKLLNNQRIMSDSLEYYSDWGGKDVSIERRDPKVELSAIQENWADSPSAKKGTPGTANQVMRDQNPPIITSYDFYSNSAIEIIYDEKLDETIALEKSNYEVFPNNSLTFLSITDNRILLFFDTPFYDGQDLEINIKLQRDIFGNTIKDDAIRLSFILLSSVFPDSVVINEFLFDEIEEVLPEFIELYNRSSRNYDLKGWQIQDSGIKQATISEKFILKSKGYAVIVSESDTSYAPPGSIFIENFPALNNTWDDIILRDPSGIVIDSLQYDAGWHNPNRFDTDGVSLEKINPLSESTNKENWSSSVEIIGGTPGRQNSIFQNNGTRPGINKLDLTPNPFSPSDQDGFEDHLFINYNLDAANYVLSIQIFDRYGRRVRTLVDGEFISQKGSIIWDGFRDNGTFNRVGRYIILFEARDNSTGIKVNFKRTVVIARK